ncbi:putative helicase [Tetrabaena socialis]|uniref:Putative helicase n=1 Tax=Tetrabaena socialis TaxID=47790 RepID=A0A2J7ZW12_9CHLO|nr:putative helicase [Tetrabaena socialis]|eukprot:PNH04444.1 putative helicase [Tetrabaena socialis]
MLVRSTLMGPPASTSTSHDEVSSHELRLTRGADGSGLYHYLLAFKVEKGSEFTHTSFSRPTGAFYIPGHSFDEFMGLYKSALTKGEDVYLTEKHRTIGPAIVDLDFRFEAPPGSTDKDKPARMYTGATIESFTKLYAACLSRYVDAPSFDVYVLEKPTGPTTVKYGTNFLVKDGLHFQIPDIVTRPVVQHLVRAEVLQGLPAIFDSLKLANRYDDVLDESIIERNNWLMYMSKKPGSHPYVVTRVLRYTVADGGVLDVTEECPRDVTVLADRFSIRNKFEETPLRAERVNDVIDHEQQLEEKRKRKELVQTVMTNQPVTSNNICENLEVVGKLVDILDAARGESYNDWVRVGWCLRNVDHRLLDKWIDFSRRSPKYVEGECARMWTHMRMGGLGMGTLHMWARTDSPERYRDIVRSDLSDVIGKSVGGAHYDIARVVHHMYRYEYVCASIRNRTWYEFRDHRWHYSDSACSLRKRLSAAVFSEYTQCALFHQHRAVNGDSEQEAQKRNMEMCNKLNAIAHKLKTTNFKDNIIKECCELFYHEKFEEKLDSNCGLLGFLNGVYDLDSAEFREGRPDDFISYTTGINFVPFSEDLPHLPDIRRFWAQVLPKDDIREYVLTLLASFLSGHTRQERFHIWTGNGCHAAGTQIMMYDGSTRNVEDVEVGDLLMGDDSTEREVLTLFRGFSDMWRIVPEEGEPFVVNGQHRLALRSSFTDEVLVMTVHEYLARNPGAEALFLYRPRLVSFEPRPLRSDISPRALGASLGRDGGARIPLEFRCNSDVIRHEVLAGIVEACTVVDSVTSQTYRIQLPSAELVQDTLALARSLGVDCRAGVENSIRFYVNSEAQFLSFRVERVEDSAFYGFELDKNHLFLLGNYIVTSNSNGKSISVELYDKALGDYTCKFPVTLLTQKRAASNSATSEIARAKGRRFACLQEPSEDERLNIGLLKELTGGDKVQARAIYKEPVEFKPQWHIALLCNHLPHVPSDDGGTWRRIRVVEFTSKFVERPVAPNEFPMDQELSQKLDEWKEPFMSLLIEYYKTRYAKKKIQEPDAVMACTREYQKNNDHFADFTDTCIERASESDLLRMADAFSEFRAWVKDDNIPIRVPKKKDVQKYLDRVLGLNPKPYPKP